MATDERMKCLNPITHSIDYVVDNTSSLKTLQQTCHKAIRKCVTISRFNQLSALPLPPGIIRGMHCLCLNDFLINPEQVTAEHHKAGIFPAKCLIDNTEVSLQVCSKDFPIPPDPTYLTSFICNDMVCHVYHRTQSLDDVIGTAKQSSTPLTEAFIWHTIHQISSIAANIPPAMSIKPKYFHLHKGQVVYKPPLTFDDMTQVFNSPDTAFYDAPEVLNQAPHSIYSQSWTIGCIMYELVALDPAYYDRSATGDIMSVMMGIVEGALPPPPPMTFSPDLLGMLAACLQKDPPARPAPMQIMQLTQTKLSVAP